MANNNLQTSLTIRANVQGQEQVARLSHSVDGLSDELVGVSRPATTAQSAIDGLGDEMTDTTQSADKMSGVMGGLKTTLGGLSGLLAGLGITMGAKELLDMSAAFATLEANVKMTTGEGTNFISAMDGIKEVADSTNTNLTETGNLFNKLATSTKEMNLSQQDLLGVTKTINQAVKLSGQSAESSAAALQQLSQGLAGGVLRGDEFNSVMEQAFPLAQAMADGLGVTIGQLRTMANEGQLTSEVVVGALQKQAIAIDERYRQLPVTIGDAITGVQNELMSFVGGLDKELGASSTIANVIKGIQNGIADIDPAALEALKLALSSLGEIASTVWGSISDVVAMLNAFNSVGNDEQVSVLTSLMQQLALACGAVADGLKVIQMTGQAVFGVVVREIGQVVEAFAIITGKGRETAQHLQQVGQQMIDSAKDTAQNYESKLGKAWDNIHKTAQDRLNETAATARQTYEQLASDGVSSAGKVEEAFIKYATAAIEASKGVIDDTLKQELAQKNLQAVISETGKISIESLSQTSDGLARATSDTDKFKAQLDELSKHDTAFKALGMDIEEFATGIDSKASAALSAFSELSGVAGEDLTKLAKLYNAAKDKVGENAEAQEALNSKLLESVGGNTTLAQSVQAYAAELANAKSATDAQNKALAELGVNMSAINAGMSDGGQKIAQSLNVGLSAIKDTATSATALKTALAQALDTATAKAQTVADFGAIKQAIEQAGLASHLTADQIKTLNTGMAGGSQAVKQALADEAHARQAVTQATDTQTKATTDNTTATQANAQSKEALAQATDKATQATEKQAVSEQKVSSGTPYFVGNTQAKILALDKLGASTDQLNQATSTLYQSLSGRTFGTLSELASAMGQVDNEINKQIQSFTQISGEVDHYTKRLGTANVSSQDLAAAQGVLQRATNATINGIHVMDTARLDNLKAQIDSTKAKMQDLADTAKNAADSLEAELARMRGNDKKAMQLENAQKLADIEKKLTEARQRGNSEEIRQLERSLSLQQQINQEKLRDVEANQRQRQATKNQAPSHTQSQSKSLSPKEVAGAFGDAIDDAKKQAVNDFARQLMDEAKRLPR